MAHCSPPKSQSVKSYTRSKPRKKAKSKPLPYVVRNTRKGAIVSRHRTLTAAIRAERRADLASYRRGQGRPYSAEKA